MENLSDITLSQEEAMKVMAGMTTVEDIARERVNANPSPAEPATDPVDPTPADDPANPVDPASPAEPTDPAEPASPAADPVDPTPNVGGIDLSDYGITTKEEVIEALTQLNKLKAKEVEIAEFDRVKSLIDDPYGEDVEAARAMAIKRDLKVPLKLAADIAALSQEDLSNNPLKALAYRDILNNPSIISRMGVDEIMAIHAKRLQIDLNDEDALKDTTLIYEATMALTDVTKKLDAYSTAPTSPLKAILEKQNTQLQETEKRKENLAKVFDIAVSKKSTIEKVFGQTKVSLAVKPQDIAEIKEETVNYLSQFPEATPQQVLTYVNERLAISNMEKLGEQLEVVLSKKYEEEAVKKAHNGQPVVKTEKPKPTENEDDPDLVARREELRKAGIDVTGFSVKRKN